ncbi:hypothetical protein ATI53_103144 [Salipiger aestuarii]|uniref:Uncharacterized protein n=1 Tax=Salipiger aestuarii TaxID=568098 RepID=A0A327Y1S6_9RHOB|nr:hypothetical protein ATI53_103144 [Salipiger aestuarii]
MDPEPKATSKRFTNIGPALSWILVKVLAIAPGAIRVRNMPNRPGIAPRLSAKHTNPR